VGSANFGVLNPQRPSLEKKTGPYKADPTKKGWSTVGAQEPTVDRPERGGSMPTPEVRGPVELKENDESKT